MLPRGLHEVEHHLIGHLTLHQAIQPLSQQGIGRVGLQITQGSKGGLLLSEGSLFEQIGQLSHSIVGVEFGRQFRGGQTQGFGGIGGGEGEQGLQGGRRLGQSECRSQGRRPRLGRCLSATDEGFQCRDRVRQAQSSEGFGHRGFNRFRGILVQQRRGHAAQCGHRGHR